MVALTRPEGSHPDDFKLSRRAAAGNAWRRMLAHFKANGVG